MTRITAWGPLGAATWWRELLEAALRQGIQVALPLLVLIGATGQWDTAAAAGTAVAVATAVAVTVLRRVTGLTAPTGAPAAVTTAYRAASALAGSLLGVLLADQTTVLTVDWRQAAVAALASAAASVLHGVVDPPASAVVDAADAVRR